jgi:hypothetical protein
MKMGLLLLMTLCMVSMVGITVIYLLSILHFMNPTRVITALTELNDVAIYLPESIQRLGVRNQRDFLKHR